MPQIGYSKPLINGFLFWGVLCCTVIVHKAVKRTKVEQKGVDSPRLLTPTTPL